MIIDLSTEIAYKCPVCNGYHRIILSAFENNEDKVIKSKCECGHSQITITRTSDYFTLDIPCFVCGGIRCCKISSKDFFRKDFIPLFCKYTDYIICAIGKESTVSKWIKNHHNYIKLKLKESYNMFFENEQIAYTAFEKINTLDENKKIKCNCGNTKVDFEISADNIQLVCFMCGAKHKLPILTQSNLIEILNINEIVLKSNTNIKTKLKLHTDD